MNQFKAVRRVVVLAILAVCLTACTSQTAAESTADAESGADVSNDVTETPEVASGQCADRAVGEACDDGDPCTTEDACSPSGECVAGSSAVCDDDVSKPCVTYVCDAKNGLAEDNYCVSQALPDGPVEDVCTRSICEGGEVVDTKSADSNDCADWVAPEGGCVDSYVCDAALARTGGSHCRPIPRPDGSPCQGELNGKSLWVQAANTAATNEDPSRCVRYVCNADPDPDTALTESVCVLATALPPARQSELSASGQSLFHQCALSDLPGTINTTCNVWQCGCTSEECAAAECQVLPIEDMLQQPCGVSDACTDQVCSPSKEGYLACEGAPIQCPVPSDATCVVAAACHPGTGCPTSFDQAASDLNCVTEEPCTAAASCAPDDPTADPVTGCVLTPAAVGSVCAAGADKCVGVSTCQLEGEALTCVPGGAPDCNDGDDCTVDSCDPAVGCLNVKEDPTCGESPSSIVQISTGNSHTCVLFGDGTVTCWGSSSYGKTTPPEGVLFQRIAAGSAHTCGTDLVGSVHCWGVADGGKWDFGQVTDSPLGVFTDLSAGYNHSCAVSVAGLSCWGIQPATITDPSQEPYDKGQVTDTPSGLFLRVVAGHSHTCGIRDDGSLQCWGSSNGKKDVPPGNDFVDLAAGYHHNCAIDSSQMLHCWGWSAWALTSAVPEGTFKAVAGGYGHNCAVRTNGDLACWGVPDGAVMGSGVSDTGQVTDMPTTGKYKFVSAGGSFSCAVRTDDKVVCWGGSPTMTSPPAELAD